MKLKCHIGKEEYFCNKLLSATIACLNISRASESEMSSSHATYHLELKKLRTALCLTIDGLSYF
jgi:hypothetical protein